MIDPSPMSPAVGLFPTYYSSSALFLVIVGNIVYNFGAYPQVDPISRISTGSYFQLILELTSLLFRVIVFFMMCTIWFLKSRTRGSGSVEAHNCEKDNDKHAVLDNLQASYPVLMSLALCVNVSSHLFHSYLHNTALDMHPLDVAFAGFKMVPVLTYFVLRDTSIKAILASWGMGVSTMLLCGIYLQSRHIISDSIAFSFCSSMIFYDSWLRERSMHHIINKLQEAQTLNEKLAVEAQALELRAMIGNVAHDLKTVSVNLNRCSVL